MMILFKKLARSKILLTFLLLVLLLFMSTLCSEFLADGDLLAADSRMILAPVPQFGLDPHFNWEENKEYLFSELYHYLYKYDHEEEELKNWLAEDFPEITETDSGDYQFKINISSDYNFKSGRKIEPKDIKYSILRLMLIDSPDSGAGYLWNVIFGVDGLSDFISQKTDYNRAVELSSQKSLELYNKIKARIKTNNNSIIFKTDQLIDLSYLLSSLSPWAAILDRKVIEDRGGWQGRPESWVYYHRTREEREPPLYDNNQAGRAEYQVVNYRAGSLLNLQKRTSGGDREGIEIIFDTSRRAGVAEAIKKDLYEFIQFTEADKKKYQDILASSKLFESKRSFSNSNIYLIAGDYKQDFEDKRELIYYKGSDNQETLATDIKNYKDFDLDDNKTWNIKGYQWSLYLQKLASGAFDFAIMEWHHPYPEKEVPEFLTRNRYLAPEIEILQRLATPVVYQYGFLGNDALNH